MNRMAFSDAFSPSRAIGAGWNGLKRSPVSLLLGSVILMASDFNCDFKDEVERGWESLWWLVGAAVVVGGFLGLLLFLLRVFVTPGYMQACARTVRGQVADADVQVLEHLEKLRRLAGTQAVGQLRRCEAV